MIIIIFEYKNKSDHKSIPQVVQALIGLSDQVHIAVRYTGINLIGELCEWLDQNPQFIGKKNN
jgi:hypothetical protein